MVCPIDWDANVLAPCMAVFGEGDPAIGEAALPLYTPVVGSAFRLADAVFDDGYKRLEALDDRSSQLVTVQPTLGVRLALFATPPVVKDTVYIPSVDQTFIVRESQPDSHGWALLMLNLVET